MSLSRRAVLAGALSTLVCAPADAHTPFRQWVVYRKKHLLIGCHRRDAGGYATAKMVAAHLAEHLPASRARVARAPAAHRLAGLIATEQLDVCVLQPESAEAMAQAHGVFAAYGRVPLRRLAHLSDGRLLLAHERFVAEHAGLVSEAIIDSPFAPLVDQSADSPIPWHLGRRVTPAPTPASHAADPATWYDPFHQSDMWSGPSPTPSADRFGLE